MIGNTSKRLARPLLLAIVAVSACSDGGVTADLATPSTTGSPIEAQAPVNRPSLETEGLDSTDGTEFEGRFFDSSIGIGQSEILFSPVSHAGVLGLAADSDVVFVGTLVGSSANIAEVRLVKELGIADSSTLIYDGLEFRVDRLIAGAVDTRTVIIGHPVLIRYDEGLARITVEPIGLLQPELDAKAPRNQWLIFARTDNETGLLTITDGRLIKLDPNGVIAIGASGEFEHRLPGSAFETSVDDVDALINRGAALPTPQTPDMTREELLKAGVPQGGILHEENLHGPDSPCYQLVDPERLAELISVAGC